MHLATSEAAAQTTTLVVVLVIGGIVAIGVYLWYGWALSRLFPKLGSEASKGWIPFVNDAEIFVLGGAPAWSVALCFIPIVNIYALVMRVKAVSRINAVFGKGDGTTALAILVPPLWATMLAASQPLSVADRIFPTMAGQAAAGGTRVPALVPPPTESGLGLGLGLEATSEAEAATDAEAPVLQAPAIGGLKPISPYLDLPSPSEGRVIRPTAPAPAPTHPTHPTPIVVARPWEPAESPVRLDSAEAAMPFTPSPTPVVTEVPAELTDPPSPPAPVAWLVASDEDPEVDSYDEGAEGETIVVDRRPTTPWHLSIEGLGEFPLTGNHVLLGRKPTSTSEAAALMIPDATRTISKVHARLDMVNDEWVITDLNSTNGVIVIESNGTERLLAVGEAAAVPLSFILGNLAMSISIESPPV